MLERSCVWSRVPAAGAPEEYYSSGSTTSACKAQKAKVTIVELQAAFGVYHADQSFYPEACRNVAMLKDGQIWLFACSWLNSNGSGAHKQFTSLGSSSLGSMLFTGDYWQRSEFEFADSDKYFQRRSCFNGQQGERLLLMEFFVKDTGCE